MKKMRNNEKAITLIALVVTIIILLILAGVTIGFAMNGTGLFEKAKLATDEYNNKVQQENFELEKSKNIIDNYAILNTRNGLEIIDSGSNDAGNSFYIKYSNGLIYQWGTLSNTSILPARDGVNANIEFVTQFSNINYSVNVTKYTDESSSGNVAAIDLRIIQKQNNFAQVRILNNSTSENTKVGKVDWIAIGY